MPLRSSGGTSAGATTRRSSPWIGNTLPITGGSRRNTGKSAPLARRMPVMAVFVGVDGDALRLAQLVDEAHAPRLQIEGIADALIDPGPDDGSPRR